MLSVGVDIVEIDRMARIIDNGDDAFLNRVFTAYEIRRSKKFSLKAEYYAMIFAFKESFVKATLTSSEENEKLEQENGKLKAQLTHRHIIGKSYEVSAESINRLAGECEELKAEIERLNQKYDFQLLVKSNEELKRQVEEAVHCLAVVKRDYNKKDQGGEMEDLVEQTLRAITKPQTEDKV